MLHAPRPAFRFTCKRLPPLMAALTLGAGARPGRAAEAAPPDDPAPGRAVIARSWLPGSGVTPGFEPERALDLDPRTYWASNDPSWDLPKDIGLAFDPPQTILGLQLEFVEEADGTLYGPLDPQTAVLEIRAPGQTAWLQPSCSVSLSRLPAGGAFGSWTLAEPAAAAAARILFAAGPRPAVRTILPVWRRWALAWTATDRDGRSASFPVTHGLAWTPPPLDAGLRSVTLQYPAPNVGGGLVAELLLNSLSAVPPAAGVRLEAGLAGMTAPAPAQAEPRCLARRPIAPALGLVAEEWLFPGPREPAEILTLAAAPQPQRALPGLAPGLPRILALHAPAQRIDPLPGPDSCASSPTPLVDPGSPVTFATRAAAEAAACGDADTVELLSLAAPPSPGGAAVAPALYPMLGKAMLGLPQAPREAAALAHGTLLVPVELEGRAAVLGVGPLFSDTLCSPLLACEIRRARDSGPPPRVTVELAPATAPDQTFAVSACVVPWRGPSGALLARFVPPTGGSWHLGVFARDARRLGAPLRPEHVFDLPQLLRPAADEPGSDAGWRPWTAAGGSAPVFFVRGSASAAAPATVGKQLVWALTGAGPAEMLVPLDPPSAAAAGEASGPAPDAHEPGDESRAPAAPDELQARGRDLWSAVQPPTGIDLTLADPELDRIARACREQILIAAEGDRVPYGAFPSVYDGDFFGVEEYWPIRALALWGDGEHAVALMRCTFLQPAYLDPHSRHHQYRYGLLGQYAWDLFSLTGDRGLLADAAPLLVEAAGWILAQTAATRLADPTSPYAGLLPRYRYGGDRGDPAYSLYSNFTCWRGLRDTGLALAVLGEQPAADRYLAGAQAYRSVILAAVDRATRRDQEPQLIPFRADHEGPVPTVGDYYQLFAGLSLETGALEPGGERPRTILRYLAEHDRTLAAIPRFGTPSGTDAHYGRGLFQELLHGQRWGEHRLALLAYATVAIDPVWCAFGEVVPLLTDSALRRRAELAQATDWHSTAGSAADAGAPWHMSDPNACGPGVLLEMIRNSLLFEELDADALPTGRLHLFPAAFPGWFAGLRANAVASTYGEVDAASYQPGPELIRISFTLRPHPPENRPPVLGAIRLHGPDATWLASSPRIRGGMRTAAGPTWVEIRPEAETVEIELRR